jgi:SAM-dependent methyltransferase
MMDLGTWYRRVSRHGVAGTLKLIPVNIRYFFRRFEPAAIAARREELAVDAQLGIHSAGTVPGGAVEAEAGTSTDIVFYAPVKPQDFDEMMQCLPQELSPFTFIDIGSGKGRALVLAAQRPFKEVIGIELSPSLHRSAGKNVERLRPSLRARIRTLNMDARQFVFPPIPTVAYFFNPFGEGPLGEVINNIERVHRNSHNQVFVLYLWPFHEKVLNERETWRHVASGRHWKVFRLARRSCHAEMEMTVSQ